MTSPPDGSEASASRPGADAGPWADAFVRIFFVGFTLFGVLSVASRFDTVLALTPPWIRSGVLFLHAPLLFVAGLLEARRRGDDLSWMGMRDRWVRGAFTLSFTYLAIVSLQVLDIEIGPVDPSPPESFPPAQRVLWYAMFSFGMGFANFLAAVGTLVPVLRFVARPFRSMPLPVSVPALALVGAAVAFGLHFAMGVEVVSQTVDLASRWLEEPAVVVGLVVAGALLPQVLGRE